VFRQLVVSSKLRQVCHFERSACCKIDRILSRTQSWFGQQGEETVCTCTVA